MDCMDGFADRIIAELIKAIKEDPLLTFFDIVPVESNENCNSSPVLRAEETLALESWVLKYVLPHANRQMLDPEVKKDPHKLLPYIWAVNLLNPEVPTAWGRRKELILRLKLSVEDESRFTQLVISWKPKCNEPLAHRRWLITQGLMPGDNFSVLREEWHVAKVAANLYGSNYHAWTHRMWAMQNLATICVDNTKAAMLDAEITDLNLSNLYFESPLPFYLKEIERNLKFIFMNVSDHSCLHYRQFLLSQVFLIFRNYEQFDGDGRDRNSFIHAVTLYTSVKQRLEHFYHTQFEAGHVMSSYAEALKHRLTIFDLILGFLIFEFDSNSSLSTIFDDHEALWSYRRSIVYSFKNLCDELEAGKNVANDVKSGESCKNKKEDKEMSKHFLFWLRRNEHHTELAFSGCGSVDAYSKWLHRFCKFDER